jgi:predicted metalloprotease with PDZ domain
MCRPVLALFLLSLPLVAQNPVRYEASFPNAVHHEAEIRVTFTNVRQPVLEVRMSRSSPGRYSLHEFAKNVYRLRASDGAGNTLPVDHVSPSQWNVSGHHGTVVVEYTLFADRADGTYAGIDETHAHLNLPAVLAWARGFERAPARIKFDLPPNSHWKVATQLTPENDGTWSAPNLDRLMDAPVELSDYRLLEWNVGDSHFRLALHHQGTDEEGTALARMCEAVTAEEEGVFGAFPKYDNGVYTFLIDLLPYVNGDGMEHRNSTVITEATSLKELQAAAADTPAHEFFHCWNVKRIRPKSLEPFNFEEANMSGELWFAEGFTQYYGELTERRAGLDSLDRFLARMGGAVSNVLNAPGRSVFNVIEMSRRAPFVDAATANDPVNTRNIFISYYTYGETLALGADLEIRARFPGKSLDDWMRAMWRHHHDSDQPYTLADLKAALAEATGSNAFATEVFDRHIYGKDAFDFKSLFARAGLLLEAEDSSAAWLGNPRLRSSASGVEFADASLRDSPLYNAGIDRGDRLVSLDGRGIKSENDLNGFLKSHKPGDRVHASVESRGGKREVDVILAASPRLHLVTYEQAGRSVPADVLAFRSAWLSSKAIHPLPTLEKYCPRCKRAFHFEYSACPFDGANLEITPSKTAEPAAQ